MSSKTIICLANSSREQGLCIAGKEVKADGSYGEWVRPVGNENTEQIEKSIGERFDLLDIITIPMRSKQDKTGHQTENWIIDRDGIWDKIRGVDYSEAQKALDLNPPQWMVEGSNSSKGKNDRFRGEADSSLCLIRVKNFTASQYRVTFSFGDKEYDLRVTAIKNSIINNMDGVILCISLIGAPDAPKTKLIAGIIIPNIGN